MSNKYIYGKYDTDTFPDQLINEFHFLCMYLGAYLKYCKNNEGFNSFDDYANAHSLTEKTDDRFYWSFINEAHAYLRNIINTQDTSNSKYISKRQIRKLGYSGKLSVPMFPKSGYTIENELFNIVFNDVFLIPVKNHFMDYVSQKWKNDPEITGFYFDPNHPQKCIEKTATHFCGFQEHVLQKEPEIKRIFQGHTTYTEIQSELERRK